MPTDWNPRMQKATAALVSLASVAAAAAIGASYGPQRPREAVWYAALRKPSFTPPGAAIGIAWGVLETLLCVTGYRLLTAPRGNARTAALAGWSATLAGLAGFPAVQFGAKKLGSSTAVAGAMLASSAATAATAAQADKVSAFAMTPLVLWTAFATLLSEELWRRN
jgi:tryptophan-rich sensory protein